MAARKTNKSAAERTLHLLKETAPPALMFAPAPLKAPIRLPVNGPDEDAALRDYAVTGRWPAWYLAIVRTPPAHMLKGAPGARAKAQARFAKPAGDAPTLDIGFSNGVSVGLVLERWSVFGAPTRLGYAQRVPLEQSAAAMASWSGAQPEKLQAMSLAERIRTIRAKR